MSTRRLLFLAPAQAITGIFPPLRDAGYELGIAENLKGASVFIRKSGPGVIFARPSLPGFRVEDLLAVSAEDPNFPPVIVTTDKGSPEEAERLLGLGARDYWLEPLRCGTDHGRGPRAAQGRARACCPVPWADTGRSMPKARAARASWGVIRPLPEFCSWPGRWLLPRPRC